MNSKIQNKKDDELFENLLKTRFDIHKPPRRCNVCHATCIKDCTCDTMDNFLMR